ncbi:PAS domain S-box protein [Rhizobium sp. WSM1325]|nr:PAS domain S-box protein [Rhizobium leguminosarum]
MRDDPFDPGTDIYRHIVESATDYAVITTSLNGIVTTWSAGASNLLGYASDEIIGQSLSLIFTFDDQLQGAFFAEMHTALSDGRAEDNRWHVRKDGSHLWASGLITPLKNDAGQSIGFVKIMRDRTRSLEEDESVRSNEERLRLILKSATDYAIFTFDQQGFVLSWNAGARRILGYEEKEIIGRDARILFTPEEREAGALEWEIETANREGRAENERFHVRKGGSRFWGSGLTMPLKARHDKVGYLKIMRDDTERHQAEEHQQVMMREMSHRVKNSLMLVTGMLAMQARGTDVAEVKRALTDAEARVATIAAMHDHLWRQTDLETIDLADFLEGLCERLAQTSNQHAIVFEGTPCRIDADGAIQVALLVNELVTNAFKHAYPSGGGRIDVKIETAAEEILLAVSDQGVGLPQGFDLRDSSRNSLGMKIIGGLVRQLKAKLAIEDAAPGARFAIHVPAALKT